jgi:hypothetical protein
MNAARKILIFGGLALALVGMTYGLVYALFIEHQTLDSIGGALTTAFVQGARGELRAATASIDDYGRAAYSYVREVDAHSHWIGLAMLLILLGVAFDRVAFSDRMRLYLAIILLLGSAAFPLGVLMQTMLPGVLPQAVAVVGTGLVILGLAGTAVGFARAH